MRWTALACFALACAAAPAFAQPKPAAAPDDMTFARLDAPNLCRGCDVIQATGSIAADSAAKFDVFLAREKIGGRPVHILVDSTGGKVSVGWALGRKWRAMGASVIAARVVERSDGAIEVRPGACISMCNSLLSAGVERRISPGTIFGVHQFSPTSDTFKNLDNAVTVRDMRGQLKLLSEWLAYAREMGVDQRLVEAQLNVPFEKVDFIAHDTLAAWRVVTQPSATVPKLLRDARPAAVAAATTPATSSPSTPVTTQQPTRVADKTWAPVRQTGEWRETNVESDADFLRVSIACTMQGRYSIQISLRGMPEARQKALAQQIIAGGGFDLVDRPVDISQTAMGFGGVFWVRAILRPDQVAKFATSQGLIRFAPLTAKGEASRRDSLQVQTAGFANTAESMLAACAGKLTLERSASVEQK